MAMECSSFTVDRRIIGERTTAGRINYPCPTPFRGIIFLGAESAPKSRRRNEFHV